jgi:hypothetical protein
MVEINPSLFLRSSANITNSIFESTIPTIMFNLFKISSAITTTTATALPCQPSSAA